MKITTSLGKKRHEQLRSIAEILESTEPTYLEPKEEECPF